MCYVWVDRNSTRLRISSTVITWLIAVAMCSGTRSGVTTYWTPHTMAAALIPVVQPLALDMA